MPKMPFDNEQHNSSYSNNTKQQNIDDKTEMMTHVDIKNAKKCQKFSCEKCNFTCSKLSNYKKHLETDKHKMMTNDDKKMPKTPKMPMEFQCECGNVYKYRQGLSVHRKKCPVVNHVKAEPIHVCEEEPRATQAEPRNNDYVTKSELETVEMMCKTMETMVTGLGKMMETTMTTTMTGMSNIVEKVATAGIGNTQNNNNHSHNNNSHSHNKTFNLNFYLNETCKDAMNIQDFIKTLQLDSSDLERVGELGYTEGISRMFLKGLNDLEETRRPIHCSDLKREVIHIKDNDKWEQDNENRDKLRKAINDISNKNIMLLDGWQKENPGYDQYDSKKNDIFLKIMVESMGPDGPEAKEKAFRKIIKKVASKTIIDKAKAIEM
jgi:hypothetical protein